jgi:DNA-binding beta-propeller fold protein YncE
MKDYDPAFQTGRILPRGGQTMRRLALLALVTGFAAGCTNSGKDSETGEIPTSDADGDGYGADDCNDSDSTINPGATEICDGIDNNCDEAIDDASTGGDTSYADTDGDGYGDDNVTSTACTPPSGYVTQGGDCDDANASINPAASEVCDDSDIDEDCDGLADSADSDATGGGTYYADQDGDGYGDPSNSVSACDQPAGYVTEPLDCDDGDALVNPAATETCNGYDDDCDGLIDDADTDVTGTNTWYMDMDGDGYGVADMTVEACSLPSGYADNSDDCDDSNGAVHPGAAEICDSVDNDCDGLIDTDDPDVVDASIWYSDNDGDGYGDPSTGVLSCSAIGVADGTDCDDSNSGINPGAQEVCDSLDADEDCDGVADDADLSVSGQGTWYADNDGDGYGDASVSYTQCDMPAASAASSDDCDDNDAAVNPGAAEVCDGIDNDCDSLVDDDDDSITDATTWYIDNDGDGYGDNDTSVVACDQPPGFVDNADDPLEDAVTAAFTTSADLVEATDVAANTTSLYVVGFNTAGEAAVFGVDTSTGATTELYSGDPLVQPTGLALSADGQYLYVSDAGANTQTGDMVGGVFEIPTSGGAAAEVGAGDVIDMPGDVALSADGTMLYVSGFDSSGDPAIFSIDTGSWAITEEHAGSPLAEPLALAANPDGSELYVLDATAAGGQNPAIIAIDTGFSSTATLATGFDIAFPGGLAVAEDGERLFYTRIRSAALVSLTTDGMWTEVVASGVTQLPAGVAVAAEVITTAGLSGTADLYQTTY